MEVSIMEEKLQMTIGRENDKYTILTKQGMKIADFCIMPDRQAIRDSSALRETIKVLEWRYRLRKDKPSGNKGHTKDLFYYQIAMNAYSIQKGVPEEGGVITIGRIICPNDGLLHKDEVVLNEILKIWYKRIYWS